MRINNIIVSLRNSYEQGEIALKEASRELCKAGWYNYVPDESQTLNTLYKYEN